MIAIVIILSIILVLLVLFVWGLAGLYVRLNDRATAIAADATALSAKVDEIETGLDKATRLAIAAGARANKVDTRCDGITNRITALVKFNNLKSKSQK